MQDELPHTTRSSSLYYFIETLRSEEKKSALDAFNVQLLVNLSEDEATCQRCAYIVQFPALDLRNHLGKQGCLMLKQAVFIERHLSIDKFFAPDTAFQGEHSFPYCHYTENYEIPEEKKRIVLHMYINSEGKVTHFQIKSIQTEKADDKTVECFEYYPENLLKPLKPMIMQNAEIALQLVKKLMLQKLNTFLSLHKKTQDFERKLGLLSLCLYKKEVQEEYLALAQIFSNHLIQLNALSDSRYIDRKDNIIKQICQRIIAGEFNPKAIEEPPQTLKLTNETEFEDTTEKNNTAVSSPLPICNRKESILKMVKKHKKQLGNFPKELLLTSEELIDRVHVLNNLRDSLLALYCLPKSSKVELNDIAALEKKLENIPSLVQSFETRAKSGKLIEVMELYPHVEDSLTISFLRELLDDVLYHNNDTLPDRIAVCDFLYKNSALYRAVLQTLISSFEIKLGLALSWLVTAFFRNNKLMFEMLLRQGANPNEVGAIKDKYIVSTMYSILSGYNNDPFYVKLLLEYGALLDFSNESFSYLDESSSLNPVLEPHPKYASVIKATLQQVELNPKIDHKSYKEFLCMLSKRTSGLLIACSLHPTSELITLLVPKSDFSGLLCSLAFLTLRRKEIKTRFYESCNQAGLRFFNNQIQCDQYTMSVTVPNGKKMTPMFLFCISEETTMSIQLQGIMKNLVENLNSKYKEMLKNEPQQLKKLLEKLMNQAKQESDLHEKKMLYKACLYLQISNPAPTIKDTESILQICAFITKICLDIDQEQEVGSAYIHCMCGINIVNKTESEEMERLKKTPIFQYLEKKLKQINIKLESQVPHTVVFQIGSNPAQAVIASAPVIMVPPKPKPKGSTRTGGGI